MQLKARKYLHDMQVACQLLGSFTIGKLFSDYDTDALLRSAVERQFEILGEAPNGLSHVSPETAREIPNFERIISFRNRLIHGYSKVDNKVVWDIAQFDLPRLAETVAMLIKEPVE